MEVRTNSKVCSLALYTVVLFVGTPTAFAQTAGAGANGVPQAAGAGSRSGAANPASAQVLVGDGSRLRQNKHAPTLADILDKISWDAEAQGPLLIVSADQTSAPARRTPGTSGPVEPIPPLEADAHGEYRMSQIEERFDRRIVGVHSLSVLAPSKMTVLNSTHLPKPDAYAGMTPDAKARLLFSTFTPQEWQAMSSPNGIGASDLKRDQRDLFLSMLPDPFVVAQGVAYAGGSYSFSNDAVPNTLSEDARSSVRLTMNKAIGWSLLAQDRQDNREVRNFGFVSSAPAIPIVPGPFLTLANPMGSFGTQNAAFGAIIREEVPNRSKPSQLPYDWSALDVATPLGQSKTVGDLVKLIAATTHSELYCDPRYYDRTVSIRGGSAQAGDILHALAWAVTGSWRRLGDAFVLTDDIEGLGVRHARIADWVQENALLAARRDAAVEKLIASAQAGDYIGWSSSDPLKPDDALAAKLDAAEKDPNSNGRPDPLVALSELPQAAQDLARKQADAWEHPSQQSPDSPARSPLRLDQVRVSERINAAFIISGVGTVDATQSLGIGGLQQFLTQRNRFSHPKSARPPANPAAPSIILDPKPALRAVVVAPQTAADVQLAAMAARRAGFTEIWVEVPRNSTELIEAAVNAGSSIGLAVRPVVRFRRAASDEKSGNRDRNILGETLSEHASWWTQQLEKIGISGAPESEDDQAAGRMIRPGLNFAACWTDAATVNRLLRDGDFIRCDTPETRAEITATVAAAASVPGISGLVLADIDAPGYKKVEPGTNSFRSGVPSISLDPMFEFGYTDANRLAFLRQNGADPIDLSPLDRGDQLSAGVNPGPSVSIALPFFRDSGTGTGSPNAGFIAMRPADTSEAVGPKVTYAKWREFREGVNAKALQVVLDSIKSKAPMLPITFRREVETFGSTGVFFGSAEPGTAPAAQDPTEVAAQPAAAPGRGIRMNRQVPLVDTARTASKTVYFAIAPGVNAPDPTTQRASLLQSLPRRLQSASDWDGVVMDLGEATVQDAVEVLNAFQPGPTGSTPWNPANPK